MSTVVLKLDGVEVNSYDNPPAMKLGTHAFAVDVRSHADGPIAIEACAHQGSVMAGLVVCTDIVTVVVDRTPPEITATVTPGATCDVWHNSARAVTFEATDVGSGIASVTRNVVLTDDGAGQMVVGTATDRAGNIASTSVTVDTDRTLVVSSAEEGGPGGLRRALSCAQPGEVIVFDPVEFPPNDPTTITLTRALPRLDKGSVAIDASNAGVILDGSEAGTVEYGLHLILEQQHNPRFADRWIFLEGDSAGKWCKLQHHRRRPGDRHGTAGSGQLDQRQWRVWHRAWRRGHIS